MRIETLAGEREPVFWGSLKQGYKWLNESKEVRLICWVITILFLLFASATLVKADTVYAYTSASDCDADRDINPKARYVATYVDEWALIADTLSNYTFYSLGGDKCFRVTAKHRERLNGEIKLAGTRATVSIIGVAALLGPIRTAAAAIANFVGWPLITDNHAHEVAIQLRNDNAADRLRDPCYAIVYDIASQSGMGVGAVDLTKMYRDCIKKQPPSTGPADREEIPRPATTSTPSSTDLSTCHQATLQAAEDYTHEGGIGEDWIDNLAKQGKTCAEIQTIVLGWIEALIESDAPTIGPPAEWPGNWPPQRPTPPRD
ncbi:MAG: hypothetical protein OXI07_09955 [Gammaproteobacteria bacterium]|nr:hypothetical protein [Gammaproteobacteria bacterium]